MDCLTYSVKEAAAIMGVTSSLVYKLIHQNEIPCCKLGSRYVIPKDLLIKWFYSNTKGGDVTCAVR